MFKHEKFFDYRDELDHEHHDSDRDNEKNTTGFDEKEMNLINSKLYDILKYYRSIDPMYNWVSISDLLNRPNKYYNSKRSIVLTNNLINEIIDYLEDNVSKLKDQRNRDYYYYIMSYDAILSNIMIKLSTVYIGPVFLP